MLEDRRIVLADLRVACLPIGAAENRHFAHNVNVQRKVAAPYVLESIARSECDNLDDEDQKPVIERAE